MADIEIQDEAPLEREDEYPHEPDDAVNYNESMYLNAFDLDQAQAAASERAHVVGRAQLGDAPAGLGGGAHHAGAGGHGHFAPVDRQRDLFGRAGFGSPEILLAFKSHHFSPRRSNPPVCLC